MKLTVQTLNNRKYPVEVDEKATVLALKQQIQAEHALGEVDDQKLIYLGKILKNDQTIESANLKPNGLIVLMISKIKKPAAAPAAAPAAEAAPAQANTAEATPAAATPATPTPAAATAAASEPATPVQPATPATSPATVAGAGATAPVADAASTTAANALTMGAGLEPMIADLMALGFPRDQVQAALRASFNNPDRAADYLFNGIPDSVMRDMGRPAGGAPAQAPAPAQEPQQPTTPAAGGAPADAADQPQAAPTGISPDNPLAGLAADPQFAQMRAMLQANPEIIPSLLQHLAQREPQLAQLIQSNPEALAELLAGGGAGAGAGAGGMPAGGPRAHTIQITLEEKQQLDNLEALGFSRQRALEAWLACDRNEELAANYLFDSDQSDPSDQ